MYASLDLGNTGQWAQFSSSSQCEREFPPSLMKKISPFQQVLYMMQLLYLNVHNFSDTLNLAILYNEHMKFSNFKKKCELM